jgi:hypothetical protein
MYFVVTSNIECDNGQTIEPGLIVKYDELVSIVSEYECCNVVAFMTENEAKEYASIL